MSKIIKSGLNSRSNFQRLARCKYKKSLLALTLTSLLAIAPSGAMAEEGEEVERIEVTGSRIKRIAMEAASPIVTIDANMIDASGFSTVSDVLRSSSLNSFGSFGGASNNGWSAQANIALKGVSAEKTLVLIDGVRLSKSPITGGSANLNMIPTAAVERIDILTDGASAVYGSDAVAGVINVILKKNFTGLEVSAKFESPDEVKGADSQKYTFTGGISSDKGSMIFSWEHYEEEAILYSDLNYATAQLKEPGLDPEYIDNWHGISGTGRVIEQWSHGWNDQAPNLQNNCSAYNNIGSGGFIGPLKRLSNDSIICGYDWTQAAQAMPETRRDSIMSSITYELSEDITLFARGMWMSQTTDDISAGDPSWFPTDHELPGRTITTAAGDTLDLTPVENGGWFGYRMNTLGDRSAEHNDNSLDLVVGLEGSFGNITWDLSANYARYDAFTWGTNYTSTPQLTSAIGSMDGEGNWSGWDPRDPDSLPPEDVRANFDKRRSTSQTSIRGGLQFDIMELPAGTLSAYVGASHSRETYYSKIDGQAEAGNVGGGNGGSGGIGERTVDAAFLEAVVPVLENLEVNLAGRYDNYSDFGSTFNPSISMSYRPVESLLLRASAGSGFQAPLLTDLYSAGSRGYADGETNYIACYLQGISPGDCNLTDEYWATAGGNPKLQPEDSDNTNIGLVWQFTDNFSMTLDYWTLETENLVDVLDHEVIQLMQIQLWEAEGEGVSISSRLPGVDIIYRGNGVGPNIEEIISPMTNAGLQKIAGYDWTVKGKVESSFGAFDMSVNWSHMAEYKTSYIDEEGNIVLGDDQLGEVWAPQDRINTSLTWSLDDHSVSLYSYYISSQEDSYVDDDGAKQVTDSLDDYTFHNLTYNYFTPWNGKLALSVLNVLNDDAPRRSDNPREPVAQLYDIRERVFTVSYTQTF
ncbi:TonB-dependent receptor [Colwelliaceae bacterium 6471]